MRGHVRQRGRTWSYIIELGQQPCQRCLSCNARYWVERKSLEACPKCGGQLVEKLERRQREQGGFRTRKEAEAALAERLTQLNRGQYVPPAKLTLGEFLFSWLEAIRADVRPSTHASYRLHVEKYITPALGHIVLSKLTPDDIKTFYSGLLLELENGKQLSPTTVCRIHATLRRALNDAVEWRKLPQSPATAVKPPRPKRPEMQTWTAEELRTFLESTKEDRLYPLWVFLAVTGCRRGEALGLRWEDVDFAGGRVHIRRNAVSVGYKVHIGEPKSGRGRSIALDSSTLQVLAAFRKKQLEEKLAWGPAYQETGFVFVWEDGMPFHPGYITAAFRKAVKRSGVKPIRLHDLRHTSATLALQSGVHPKVVAERLGHSNIQLTLSIYSHVIPTLESEAAERLASLILE